MEQQTKRDLYYIMKASTRKEITNKDALKKIIKISETTDNFGSPIGKVFINRVKKLINEGNNGCECIICKKNNTFNGIVCNTCIKSYVEQLNKEKQQLKNKVSSQKVEATSEYKKQETIETKQVAKNKYLEREKTKNTAKISNNRLNRKTIDYNSHQDEKKMYRKSLLGTIMYTLTSFMRKKAIKEKMKKDATYQEPVSGHVFIGLFTVLFFLIYLFSLYAGAVILFIGIGIAICSFIKKISQLKGASFTLILISIIFWPIGLILLCLGIIKKFGYLYNNRKYIGLGFVFYGFTAIVCGAMHDVPGNFCAPGIVGYLRMIFCNDFGTRWDRTQSGAIYEMIVFIVAGVILTFFAIGAWSLYLDEVEEYCFNKGLSVKQVISKMLQCTVEVLLMFAPLLLFVLCKIETLEDGWALDIDNETHEVSAYRRFRNGKWEDVSASTRRNPDDIINNNLSYRGNNRYNGRNPVRNNRNR